MTVTQSSPSADTGPGDGATPTAGRLSRTFVLIIAAGAVVLLLVGGTLGLALSGRIGTSRRRTPTRTRWTPVSPGT